MTQNTFVATLKFIFIDVIGDIVVFPVWWYTAGMVKSARFFWRRLTGLARRLGVGIWVKNLFQPMYGRRDWQSLMISFFMRLVQIIVRSAILIIWAVVLLAAFIFWLTAPILVIYKIILSME